MTATIGHGTRKGGNQTFNLRRHSHSRIRSGGGGGGVASARVKQQVITSEQSEELIDPVSGEQVPF